MVYFFLCCQEDYGTLITMFNLRTILSTLNVQLSLEWALNPAIVFDTDLKHGDTGPMRCASEPVAASNVIVSTPTPANWYNVDTLVSAPPLWGPVLLFAFSGSCNISVSMKYQKMYSYASLASCTYAKWFFDTSNKPASYISLVKVRYRQLK